MTKLHELYDRQGQSPWVDDLHREWLTGGHFAELCDRGVRGVTSNPTIFAKAIEGTGAYDEQLRSLTSSMSVEGAYWEMVVDDIEDALGALRPVYDQSGGADGFVSLEVAPSLARDTGGSVASARSLHQRIHQANLLVKVPGTAEGVPAIRQLLSEGLSINVTLIFGLDRYDQVAEAYLSGLEAFAASGASDLSGVHSVASFFVSRVDTEVDRRLEALAGGGDGSGDPAILDLRGKTAVAQAQVAYEHFATTFAGPRWDSLAAKGARRQRPLWASTSTKNPHYPDLLYVDSLVGPDTVSTMPEPTLDAFIDHGRLERAVDTDLDAAHRVLDQVSGAGVDMADVSTTLEEQGVSSFSKSFDELLQSLTDKASAIG
ncbi:MAG: transaldolase [Acidimicrobiales bacterium]